MTDVPLLRASPFQCRYEVGQTITGKMACCGAPVFKRSYCVEHFPLIYVVGTAITPKPVRDVATRPATPREREPDLLEMLA